MLYIWREFSWFYPVVSSANIFFHKTIVNKILHNVMSFIPCHYKRLPNILRRESAVYLSSWRFFHWVGDFLKKISKANTHTHTHTRIDSSFATWAMILFEGCIFFSKSPSSHNLPLAKNQSSLLHTLYSQPCFSAFPTWAPPTPAASSLGPPHLPISITSSAGNSALLHAPPAPPALGLPPPELLIPHSSSNPTLKASPGFYLAIGSQCKMFWDTLY